MSLYTIDIIITVFWAFNKSLKISAEQMDWTKREIEKLKIIIGDIVRVVSIIDRAVGGKSQCKGTEKHYSQHDLLTIHRTLHSGITE